MPINAFSFSDWQALNASEFSEVYNNEDLQALLGYVETRFRNELVNLVNKLSSHGDIFFTLRIKDLSSAYNKLSRLEKYDPDLDDTDSQSPPHSSLMLFNIIEDLIGVRIICVDEDTRRLVETDLMSSENIKIRYKETYVWKGLRTTTQRPDEVSTIVPNETKSKQSHYESVHLLGTLGSPSEVRGEPPMDPFDVRGERLDVRGRQPIVRNLRDPVDIEKQLFGKLNRRLRGLISKVPVEIQLRTFSEHIWARDEHTYMYSLEKSGKFKFTDQPLIDELREHFTILKHMLIQVEEMRASIRRWNLEKIRPLTWKDRSFELRSRVSFFKFQNGSEDFVEKMLDVDHAIREAKLDSSSYVKIVHDVLTDVVEYAHEYHALTGENLLEWYPAEFDVDRWGRQRLLLLAIGYMFLFGKDIQAASPSFDKALSAIKRLHLVDLIPTINVLHEKRMASERKKYTTSLLARRIYEFVYKNDQYALQKCSDERAYKFLDPLVYSRLATAHYRTGDFSGAMRIGEELLFNHPRKALVDWYGAREKEERLLFHPRDEFVGRLIEYTWYNAYGKGYGALVESARSLDNLASLIPTTADGLGYVKSRCWLIIIQYIFLLNDVRVPERLDDAAGNSDQYLIKNLDKISRDSGFANEIYFNVAAAISLSRRKDSANAKRYLEIGFKLLADGIPHPSQVVEIYHDILKSVAIRILPKRKRSRGRARKPIFISYAHEQNDLLKRFRSFAERKINIVGDFTIRASDQIDELIESMMSNADAAILFVSNDYLTSQYCQLERRYFQRVRRLFPSFPIFVLLIDVTYEKYVRSMPLLSDTKYIELKANELDTFHEIIAAINETLEGR